MIEASEREPSDELSAKLVTLRTEIKIGIQQADHGDFVEFTANEIIAQGRERRAATEAPF